MTTNSNKPPIVGPIGKPIVNMMTPPKTMVPKMTIAWETMLKECPHYDEKLNGTSCVFTQIKNKFPLLMLMIKELYFDSQKADVILIDLNGSVRGTIHMDVLERYKSQLEVGAVLELVQVTFFKNRHSRCLNITLRSIKRIFTLSNTLNNNSSDPLIEIHNINPTPSTNKENEIELQKSVNISQANPDRLSRSKSNASQIINHSQSFIQKAQEKAVLLNSQSVSQQRTNEHSNRSQSQVTIEKTSVYIKPEYTAVSQSQKLNESLKPEYIDPSQSQKLNESFNILKKQRIGDETESVFTQNMKSVFRMDDEFDDDESYIPKSSFFQNIKSQTVINSTQQLAPLRETAGHWGTQLQQEISSNGGIDIQDHIDVIDFLSDSNIESSSQVSTHQTGNAGQTEKDHMRDIPSATMLMDNPCTNFSVNVFDINEDDFEEY
ncbi:hypothetical protein BC833DRAFT_578070 [Globomyces pollinis-pini]|nr:hypothetical protein BC833DRAFT_578070 [Globomyces pollinis-pini]